MRKILFYIISLLSFSLLNAQQEATTSDGKKVILFEDGTWQYAVYITEIKPVHIDFLEIPENPSSCQMVVHAGYTLSYNEEHEQANWVAYELTEKETEGKHKRTNKFIVDPDISTGSATSKDYKKSGYDQGHLVPAADMAWSQTAMTESFYYSNMSPQEPSFNRGIWKKLEEQVRGWARENNAIYVITGPVLTDGLPTIGPNKVSVPKYYYKVILDYTLPEIKAIGFIMPNAGSSEPLQSYTVTVDSVEKFTGIDFFYRLPDDQEKIIESILDVGAWFKE
ncbi:MAG: DNA/RNA non-specific endonuclease [Candidatus Edwardsbacteria bacterium]|nr:DNA/RNA non-specific endonuclease [Candidatus Edwardsbacteria bacterium]MBU1576629.1 DNA/RNA non-specific endonuclease [Candidatus Edwardsbacteria bacterium]